MNTVILHIRVPYSHNTSVGECDDVAVSMDQNDDEEVGVSDTEAD